jgi:hypothetical protein
MSIMDQVLAINTPPAFDEITPPGRPNRCGLCGQFVSDRDEKEGRWEHSMACSRRNPCPIGCDHKFRSETCGLSQKAQNEHWNGRKQ